MGRFYKTSYLLLTVLLILSACAPIAAPAQISPSNVLPTLTASANKTPTQETPTNIPPTQTATSTVTRETTPQVLDPDLKELVGGNSSFAFDFYHQIDSGDGNLFYSPYSISIALAMTYAGARGRTAEQMAQVMHYSLPAARLHPAFKSLALELASRSKAEGLKPGQAFQLNVANSLWGQSGWPFNPVFLDVLEQNYGAGLRLVDYEKDPEAARLAINDWVSQSTEERIKDIIPPGAIDDLTRLVLANAIYFKAAWALPFEPEATKPEAFHLLDGRSVDVPMMRESAYLRTMQGTGYRAVELPYASGELSMLVLLPDEGRFADFETRLNSRLVEDIVAALRQGGQEGVEVALTLPKFKIEWMAGLKEALEALGMKDAFSEDADFSGMDGKLDLSLSAAIHKTFVSVDEQGTEAAAATAISSGIESVADYLLFKVDRPFIIFIRDNPTGTILFVGRVMNPLGG